MRLSATLGAGCLVVSAGLVVGTAPPAAAATSTTGTTKTTVSAYAGTNTAADTKTVADHNGTLTLSAADSDSGPDGSASGTVSITSGATADRIAASGQSSTSKSTDASVSLTPSSVSLTTILGEAGQWVFAGSFDATGSSTSNGCISGSVSVTIYAPGSTSPSYYGNAQPGCSGSSPAEGHAVFGDLEGGGIALEAGSKIKIFASFDGPSSFATGTSSASFSVEVKHKPAPVSNTATPTLSGSGKVGTVLTSSNGAWTGSPNSFAYQWTRGGTPVPRATARTFQVGTADVGKVIQCRVTASNGASQASQLSSGVVGKAIPLRNTKAPAISGVTQVGSRLTASAGTWSPAPTGTSYQWLRNGAAVTGATRRSYVPVAKDVGTRVSVRVTVRRAGYQTSKATSAARVVRARD